MLTRFQKFLAQRRVKKHDTCCLNETYQHVSGKYSIRGKHIGFCKKGNSVDCDLNFEQRF